MGAHADHGLFRRGLVGLAALLVATACVIGAVRPARAFCGFYVGGADKKLFNNATVVVLLRDGTRTVLSMQNNYQGPPESFAMVVPVPVVLQQQNVKTLPAEVFDHVDQLAAPRLVEYWEQDPCSELPAPTAVAAAEAAPGAKGSSIAGRGGAKVTIEAQFTVGEYDIVVLSATDSAALEKWLKDNRYSIPAGAEPYLRPYVRDGSKFFVAKVDVTKVKIVEGRTMLSPLRFHYDSPDFRLPVRLGLANSSGTQDLVVHVLARDQRYEVANYKNVTIPTNIDIDEKARGQFSAFYAALFDKTLESNFDSDKRPPVVTEYSWQAASCDPCPGPVLSPSDIATLGADTLDPPDEQVVNAPERPRLMGKGHDCGCKAGDLLCAMKCAGTMPPTPPQAPRMRAAEDLRWVLTRLHARYTKDQLAEDLVFRAAPPIVGGREMYAGAEGKLEVGAAPSQVNNFQGRYAIRHPWTQPLKCDKPYPRRWGPPWAPNEDYGPKAARETAFAPRGGVDLASLVKGNVPEIGLVAKQAPLLPSPSGSGSAAAPGARTGGSGCGCRTSESGNAGVAGWLGVMLGLLGIAKRRRRGP